MEPYDIYIKIGKRRLENEFYSLTVENEPGERHTSRLLMDKDVPSPSGLDLGISLNNALTETSIWNLIDECYISAKKKYSQGAFLIEIEAPELYALPWENIFDAPVWSYLSEVFTVTRYLARPSSVVTTPLHLPLDVLIFTGSLDKTIERLPTEDSLKYFRATKSIGVSSQHLRNLLKNLKYDIVQISGRAEFRESNTSIFFPGIADQEVTPRDLLLLLKRCGARLLILQCFDENYGALLNFAHNILHADGPTIIALIEPQIVTPTEPQIVTPWNFNELYMQIVHDQNFDIVFSQIPRDLRPALLLASGGADVLRISSTAPRLYAQLESQLKDVKVVHDSLSAQIEQLESKGEVQKFKFLSKNLAFLNEKLQVLENEIKPENMLDFEHESGGMEPLKMGEMLSSEIDERLKDMETHTRRVVNSWFSKGKHILNRDEGLEPETSYKFRIQIGVASEKSNVTDAVFIPEEELARFYSKEGINLRIVLYSSDFEIRESEKILVLPPLPNESNPVMFDVVTPESKGIARMRVCIYFNQNLIQSLLVQALVGEPTTKEQIKGSMAEVDYSLSGDLASVERFPARTLNIAMNHNGNGTHSFFIAGTSLKRQFDFGEGEIRSSITEVRKMLQSICSEKDSKGNMRYRYSPDNIGNEKDFIKDVTKLAELGSVLYAEIITNQEPAFQDQLSQTLGKSNSIIQISSTKSAKYVFPWALVYDKPLVEGNNNVCSKFIEDLKKGGPPGYLNSQDCLVHGCQYEADTSIICPSGFWGYKHIIEQPLSLEKNERTGAHVIPLEIKVKGATVSTMMGVSLELIGVQEHRQEIQILGAIDIDFKQTKQQIGIGLQRKDLHLIYFYCHGGREGGKTWLGIGKGERLRPRELVSGWHVNWPIEHPFVFINGCHTVDVTPDDFLDFNKTFSWCEASGVMGTEITIPESLARHFASGFLRGFLNGNDIGKSIHDQRLAMLANYNLLGLAYTPYCSASLKLVHS